MDASDRNVFTPGARLAWEFLPPDSEEPRVAAATLGLEFEFTRSEGDDTTAIPSGSSGQLDNVPVAGPAQVEVDLELQTFRARLLAPIAEARTLRSGCKTPNNASKLTVSHRRTPVYSDRVHYTTTQGEIGARLTIQPVEGVAFYGQYSGTSLVEEQYAILEAAVRLTFDRNSAIIIGWRHVEIDIDQHSLESDLDIEMAGPLALIEVRF